MEYIAIKHTHVMFALLSIILFYTRTVSRFMSGKLAKNKLVFIGSHVIDTLLLVSAVALLVVASMNPLQQPWLIEKIVLVIVYIGLGFVVAKSTQFKTQVIALAAVTVSLLLIGYLAGSKASLVL
ncbi:MAG: transcriptional regulator [Pseudoalteromonas sp.]|nr:transcriptional regulator [Pseudoalteromonas sp.]